MGYTYQCDGCGEGYNTFPPFAGEFTEQFLKTIGGKFAMGFKPGQKVTICADCMELYVLAGTIAVCERCGFSSELEKLPDHIGNCPMCEEDSLTLRKRGTDD